MKRAIILMVIGLIPILTCSQSLEQLDYISAFNEGLAAIQKDGQWAFINEQGDIVINYRNDLVTTNTADGEYPVFNNGRCLIVKEKNGITYFGYIDKTGKTAIEPQFLNATNFDNNIAVALKLVKEEIGKNKVLGKNVFYHRYYEVTINNEGVEVNYLNPKGVNIVLDKDFLKKPPKITALLISHNLFATMNKHRKWSIKKIQE